VTLTRADKEMTHRQFQTNVLQLAKILGYTCYWTWRSIHSPAGWLDLILIRSPRFIVAELKTEKDKLKPAQQECFDALKNCGIEAYVWRPHQFEEIGRILRR
jgi:hypothetical protein